MALLRNQTQNQSHCSPPLASPRLASQAITILKELHGLTGTGRFVFPGARTHLRPMSDNAILAAMRRMGIGKEEMCGHGFRAMARTILDEVLSVRPELIEHQLTHAVRDPNGRAYNRTAHLPARKQMMQLWADYLDKLRNGLETDSLQSETMPERIDEGLYYRHAR